MSSAALPGLRPPRPIPLKDRASIIFIEKGNVDVLDGAFVVRADALANTRVRWNWFEVEKQVSGRVAVQFERLLQELTAALPASYIRIPREGVDARFLPVKDYDELRKREREIRAVAKARGML